MRAILGEIDTPCSDYILILRGINYRSKNYFEYHRKKYPTWGCLLFPDIKQVNITENLFSSTIHRIYTDPSYAACSDRELIEMVKEALPPYSEEDDDSVISTEYTSKDSKVRGIEEPGGNFNFSTSSEISVYDIRSLGEDIAIERSIHSLKSHIIRELVSEPSCWNIKRFSKPDGSTGIIVTLRVAPPEKSPFEKIAGSLEMLKEAACSVTGVSDFFTGDTSKIFTVDTGSKIRKP